MHHATVVVVARSDDRVVGAYYLKPNQPGRAAHIANAGYVVDRPYRGRGIGRLLVEDSIRRAPLVGFDAIQFNLVFESNPARRAVRGAGLGADRPGARRRRGRGGDHLLAPGLTATIKGWGQRRGGCGV